MVCRCVFQLLSQWTQRINFLYFLSLNCQSVFQNTSHPTAFLCHAQPHVSTCHVFLGSMQRISIKYLSMLSVLVGGEATHRLQIGSTSSVAHAYAQGHPGKEDIRTSARQDVQMLSRSWCFVWDSRESFLESIMWKKTLGRDRLNRHVKLVKFFQIIFCLFSCVWQVIYFLRDSKSIETENDTATSSYSWKGL